MSTDTLKQNSAGNGNRLQLIIEGHQYEWSKQYILGTEIKKLAGLPVDADIYLSVTPPWKDETILDDTSIDLAWPEIEHFYMKKELKLIIDGKHYTWPKQYITGRQIKEFASLIGDYEIFLSISGPWQDEKIEDGDKIDLARPGIEHFYSKELPVHIILIVNGREKVWNKRMITFQEVVVLAFNAYNDAARTCYTVTYKNGPKENPKGTMVFGDTVFVQNKMIFNVTATDKS